MSQTTTSTSFGNVYRVRNWMQLMGPARGRSASGPLGRLARIGMSSGMGQDTLIRRRLFNLPQGVASYSVWLLLVQIAAQTTVPGCLLDEQSPLTIDDLSLLTDVPVVEMRVALENLSRPEIRLIEIVTLEEALRASTPAKSGDTAVPASLPLATNGPSTVAMDLPQPISSAPELTVPILNSEAIPLAPAASGTTAKSPRTDLSPTRPEASNSPAAANIGDEAQQAEEQLARLLGVFNQVQEMKQQVNSMSPHRSQKKLVQQGRSRR